MKKYVFIKKQHDKHSDVVSNMKSPQLIQYNRFSKPYHQLFVLKKTVIN